MTINLIPEVDEEEKNSKDKVETPEEKAKRIGNPTHDVEALMKEMGLEEQIPNLEKHEIDSDLFWALGDGELKDMIEVKVHGQRKRLLKRIEEIKKEHEEAMEKKHKEAKKPNIQGIHFMLKG